MNFKKYDFFNCFSSLGSAYRIWSFGLGYGAAWSSLIFLFVGEVLLLCDRESEEVFYKEKDVEEGDGIQDEQELEEEA